jgi:hypothetical protein
MRVFLKSRDVHIKREHFGGEGMLSGKFLCAPDAALPGRDRHGAIINAIAAPQQ